MVGQGLAQAGEIVYAAANAVEAVGEDFFHPPRLHVGQQPLEGRTVGVFAGKALVGVGFGCLLRREPGAAGLDLQLDRNAVRLVHRLAGVNGRHGSFPWRGSGRSKPARMRATRALSTPGG